MSSDLISSGPYQYGDPSKTNLLITGGSLGARAMYEGVCRLSAQSDLKDFNIIIILGALNINMRPQFEGRVHIIDFADQATMGSLYQRADVCICRGGTTSLAEMQIFEIRKLILPLPITHDQQTNAQYYVDHHGDHLIMQDSQIISSLQQGLEQYIGYHKKPINIQNISLKVQKAKTAIINTLLTIN